jgi:CubicO group peptidase (beta-lactamase class C family)
MGENIPQFLEVAAIPGFSLALINNATTEFYKAYGVKRIGADDRVNHRTVFEAASLTKPVMAYCALLALLKS